MRKSKLLKTDSIQKLAEFWDTHDFTDFEGELEAVDEPVFARSRRASAISVPLAAREAKAIEKLAQSKGLSPQDLVRTWVLQNIRAGQIAMCEKKEVMAKGNIYVEQTDDGRYAVRRAGSERASAILPTQAEAIERAREISPGTAPDVERVRHTSEGKPDRWRKA